MFFNDKDSWTNGYWQASAIEMHARKHTNTAEWMLKSNAITEHGGGKTGETAIDEAVAAGLYEECVIYQIRVKGEKSDTGHSTSLEEKARVGC